MEHRGEGCGCRGRSRLHRRAGRKLLLHERLTTSEGESEYALVAFAGTRILFTPKPIFEDHLPAPPPFGLTHAVFEVDQLEPEIARLHAIGTEMLIPPVAIEAGFGARRIAFFRSPGGLVFEMMEIESEPPGLDPV